MLDAVGDEPVAAARGAHERLVESLFGQIYSELVGLAGLILGERAHAEDVVQDAFAGLYRRAEPLDDADGAVGYLRRSVVNGARSRLRRREVERRPHLAVVRAAPSVEDRAVADDDARAVAEAVAQLPVRQRECVACHFQLGLTHTETAATLGIAPGSVKSHLHRATRRLAVLLEDRR
jgi:RNA polymerase sigma factor (sigma-70 family)